MNSQNKEVRDLMVTFLSDNNTPFINKSNEIILYPKYNVYFKLGDIENERDLKAKVLAWLSRPAHKDRFYHEEKYDFQKQEYVPYKYGIRKNKETRQFFLDRINRFLKTNFSTTDIELIYDKLGNDVNRELTYKFIDSGYNMEVLKNGSRN